MMIIGIIFDSLKPEILLSILTIIVSLYIPVAVMVYDDISKNNSRKRGEDKWSIDSETLLTCVINAKNLMKSILIMIVMTVIIGILMNIEGSIIHDDCIRFCLRLTHILPLCLYAYHSKPK